MPGLKTTQKHFNKTGHFQKLAREIQNPNMYIYRYIIYGKKSKRTTTTLPSCQEHLLVRSRGKNTPAVFPIKSRAIG